LNLDISIKNSALQPYFNSVSAASRGERLAILLFVFTCIQAAFLQPNVTLVPGERAKLFTGLLCALSLAACVLFVKRPVRCGSIPEISVSVILSVLIILSGLMSCTALSSSFRGLVVIASAAGGFWCARMLLDTDARQALFTQFCTIILAAIIALSILGQLLSGDIVHFLDVNPHPIACRVLILYFAPLALILRGGRPGVILGVSLLCLSYVVFLVSNLRSAALIPVALGVIAVIFGTIRLRYFAAILVPLILILGIFFHSLPAVKIGLDYEPAYYRAENYPFSWHIAKKHPILGIGLRAPREGYLEDYEIRYPYVNKETFRESVTRIVTSENIFLNFMVDLGFPFLILYTASIIILLFRLIRVARKKDSQNYLPAMALLLPITAALMHFQVLDGLLHPQITWFFHILLGMIPRTQDPSSVVNG